MAIHIGCGSWTDDAYVGTLYPKGAPKAQRLQLYSQWFERVELNNTYYTTPSAAQMSAWAAQTPAGFRFDFKLHKAFSERPATSGELVTKLRAAVAPLREAGKLGAFLLTLSPSFAPGKNRLEEIETLQANLPDGVPLAVELRHRGWVDGDARETTLEFFRRCQLGWVALDLPPLKHPAILPVIDEVTDPRLAYVRLHGRNPGYAKAKDAAGRHHYDYPEKELEEIVVRLKRLATKARSVHVSVNNHAENFAPKAALTLRRLLGQKVSGPALESKFAQAEFGLE